MSTRHILCMQALADVVCRLPLFLSWCTHAISVQRSLAYFAYLWTTFIAWYTHFSFMRSGFDEAACHLRTSCLKFTHARTNVCSPSLMLPIVGRYLHINMCRLQMVLTGISDAGRLICAGYKWCWEETSNVDLQIYIGYRRYCKTMFNVLDRCVKATKDVVKKPC